MDDLAAQAGQFGVDLVAMVWASVLALLIVNWRFFILSAGLYWLFATTHILETAS